MSENRKPTHPKSWHIVVFPLGGNDPTKQPVSEVVSVANEDLGMVLNVYGTGVPANKDLCPDCKETYNKYKSCFGAHGTRYVKIVEEIPKEGVSHFTLQPGFIEGMKSLGSKKAERLTGSTGELM